ncbi:MAG: hypothetical protein EOP63_12510 [Sphingomonadales bacterium]|nr:MAG: hypothetical protein EOP63_12510 [Sphingomonadales bacterium]
MGLSDQLAGVDWAATGTMIQGLGTLGGAIAVYAAARLGLLAWRHQKLAERNRDQAEVILHAAYNARRALGYLRSPWMSGSEQVAAQEKLDADEPNWRNSVVEEKQKRLVTAQAYYMRASKLLDERSKLEDCLPMARALFGEELEQAIESLCHQFHVVLTYADAYVDDYNGTDRDFSVKIRRALFASNKRVAGDENEVSDAIEKSIGVIEGRCLPYLRLEA